MGAARVLLSLLAFACITTVQSKLVVYGPQELIEKFQSTEADSPEAKSKFTLGHVLF